MYSCTKILYNKIKHQQGEGVFSAGGPMKKLQLLFTIQFFMLPFIYCGNGCSIGSESEKITFLNQQKQRDHEFWKALEKNNFKMAGYWLAMGALPPVKPSGESALHVTARKGKTSLLLILLNTQKNFLDYKDYTGSTPLHAACANGQTECAEILLKSGADPDSKDTFDESPLCRAITMKHPACVNVLLKYNAKPHSLKKSPFVLSATLENIAIFDEFMKRNTYSPEHKYPPELEQCKNCIYPAFLRTLLFAQCSKPEIAKTKALLLSENILYALKYITRILINIETEQHDEDLHYFAMSGEAKSLSSTIKKGVSEQALNGALHAVVTSEKPRTSCIRLLIDAGASPLVEDIEGHTLVELAIDKDVICLLEEERKKADALSDLEYILR